MATVRIAVKVFVPKGDDKIFCSYIGPTTKAFAVYLKYKIKVSDRDIADLFYKMQNACFLSQICPFCAGFVKSTDKVNTELQTIGYLVKKKFSGAKLLLNFLYLNCCYL